MTHGTYRFRRLPLAGPGGVARATCKHHLTIGFAVTPCDRQDRPTGPAHRERVADQEAAEARSAAVVLAIQSGQWPEPPPAPTRG